jgi:hypothetical protein
VREIRRKLSTEQQNGFLNGFLFGFIEFAEASASFSWRFVPLFPGPSNTIHQSPITNYQSTGLFVQ